MTVLKLLAIVGAISILVGLGLTSLSTILNPRAEGGMHGAGFDPSDFALATHFFGLIVMISGVLMLIAAAVIARNSN